MNTTTDRAKIDRYIDSLLDMTDADLLAEYECCVRQNNYGSHDEQKALVRSVLLRRMVGHHIVQLSTSTTHAGVWLGFGFTTRFRCRRRPMP